MMAAGKGKRVIDNLLGSPNTTTYIYDPVGNLDHFVYPNGVVHQYGYNELDRLRQSDVTDNVGALLRRYTYTMNSTGQRTGVIESAGNPVAQRRRVAYEYDQIYGTSATTATRVSRLTRETLYNASDAVAGTITHAYDAVGNRIARTVANFSPAVNGLGNQTLAYDQRDLIDGDANPANANPWYDLNGNSLADETGAGTGDIYDAENRLIQRGSGMFFSYDENGNRVKKVTPSGTTYYLVDDRNPTGYAQVLAEYSSVNTSVAPTVTYTIGAELISQNRCGTVRYYGYDGQGSVRFLTDATISTAGGAVTQITDTYDYEACGMLLTGSGTTPNNYRYTGQQWDDDLGMYYLRARYYQPGIGRFWTMDTYEGRDQDPRSLHKYLYCQSDPINYRDPSGHDMGELALDMSIRVSIYAAAVTPYAVYSALALGTLYIATSTAISVDDCWFGGTHTGSLCDLRDASGNLFFIAYFVADSGQAVGLTQPAKGSSPQVVKIIEIPKSRYSQSAQHIVDAQSAGKPMILTVDRSLKVQNRAAALKNTPIVPGFDRDEYPPSVFAQGGAGSSVWPIDRSDNPGSGAFIGNQLRDVPNGAAIKIEVIDDTKEH